MIEDGIQTDYVIKLNKLGLLKRGYRRSLVDNDNVTP